MTNCTTCDEKVDLRSPTLCSICHSPLHKRCAINKDGTFCDTCYIEHTKTPTEIKLPTSIRRSHIELYMSCPYSFYLEVIMGNKSNETIYTRLGSDIHTLFERRQVQSGYTKTHMLQDMHDIWGGYDDDLFGDVSREKMWLRATTSIENFCKIELPSSALAIEEKLSFFIAEHLPTVNITMDRIDEVKGSLYIRDWKTGAVMVGKKFTTDLQAPLYIRAVQEKYALPVEEFHFYYVGEDKERVFQRVTDDEYVCRVKNKEYFISIQETLGRVKSAFSHMKNGDFNIPYDTRRMFFTCKMCPQRVNGLCPGADEVAWRQVNEQREEENAIAK